MVALEVLTKYVGDDVSHKEHEGGLEICVEKHKLSSSVPQSIHLTNAK
jgi:hypothetical protein